MKILIIRDKHYTYRYNASTKEALYRNALAHLENVSITYIKSYECDRAIINAATKAIDENNGKLAWNVIKTRSDDGHLYEECSIEDILDNV